MHGKPWQIHTPVMLYSASVLRETHKDRECCKGAMVPMGAVEHSHWCSSISRTWGRRLPLACQTERTWQRIPHEMQASLEQMWQPCKHTCTPTHTHVCMQLFLTHLSHTSHYISTNGDPLVWLDWELILEGAHFSLVGPLSCGDS